MKKNEWIRQLKYMKAMMAERGNWNQVKRINKMIRMNRMRIGTGK